jgi:hypothetical protein
MRVWKTVFILGYKVVAKGYHEAAGMGIFGSNVSKLEVYKGATRLLHFDRGMSLNLLPDHIAHAVVGIVSKLF